MEENDDVAEELKGESVVESKECKKDKLNIRLLLFILLCTVLSLFMAVRLFYLERYILGAFISCYVIGGIVFIIKQIKKAIKKVD
ncbi:MAG: hypothetical protein VZR06_06125 [Butyrivibrio sp.]|nr:hypothetical protein [Butyrivibrio sp.]